MGFPMSNAKEPCVFLYEKDQATARTVNALCKEKQLALHSFSCWEKVLHSLEVTSPCCVILSFKECSVSERVHAIVNSHKHLPVIVLGQQHDLTSAVASIQAGAIDYIEKPEFSGRLVQHISQLSA